MKRKCLQFSVLFIFCGVFFQDKHISAISELSGEKITVDLSKYESKIFSQNGEDGIIKGILNHIDETNKYYVEFGVADGWECNTRLLREQYGWHGLMMDSGYSRPEINLHQAYITAENINSFFDKFDVPNEFDILSIDIDYNDFYIWKAINSQYSPKVVIIEHNATHLPGEDRIAVYKPNDCWDGTNYFGASITAMARLGEIKGYTLVYVDNQGVNLFFVRNDILVRIPYEFKNAGDVFKLYKYPQYGNGPNGGHRSDPLNRPYLSSYDVL